MSSKMTSLTLLVALMPAVAAAIDTSGNPPPPNAQSQSPSNAGTASSRATTGSDLTFPTEARVGNMMEVELGQMALTKSSNRKGKEFAQRMIDDHSKANAELQALAAKKGISLKT